MVTARSRGDVCCRACQRAASQMSAVESGPPEIASTRAGSSARSANRRSASVSATGTSTVATLLFPLDRLLHVGRGAGKFADDLAEGRAGELFFVERGERLAKPQQRIRRL